MTLNDALTLVGAVVVSFGGGAFIVIALSGWLADLWAKRILQKENASLQTKIDEIRHELSLERSSYEHYLDLVLDYYTVYYAHYRLCQRTSNADAHSLPGGSITHTKDEFMSALDTFLANWAAQEGKIRLLLPSEILSLHEEAIDSFNCFKRSVERFRSNEETRKEKQDAFSAIENVKVRLEDKLRKFLRTERLLK